MRARCTYYETIYKTKLKAIAMTHAHIAITLVKMKQKWTKMQDQKQQKHKWGAQVVVNPLKTEDLTSWREMFLGKHLMRHRSIRFHIILPLKMQIIEPFLLSHKYAAESCLPQEDK